MRNNKIRRPASNHAASRLQVTQLVDGSTIASALAISTRTLHRLRRRGNVGFYRIGRTIRYDVAEVMEALSDYHVMSRQGSFGTRA